MTTTEHQVLTTTALTLAVLITDISNTTNPAGQVPKAGVPAPTGSVKQQALPKAAC